MCETEKKVIKAAVNIIVESVLNLIQKDPHQWSARPCSTCRAISSIINKPFGCILYAIEKKKNEQLRG